MAKNLSPDSSLEDLMDQFRLAAAGIQGAYHQLEQELLSGGQTEWETVEESEGLALPNLAPLHLMGSLVGGLSASTIVVNQQLDIVTANGDARQQLRLTDNMTVHDVLAPDTIQVIENLLENRQSKSNLEIYLKGGTNAGMFDGVYLDNPIEKGRLLLLVGQDLEIDHLHDVEDQILKNLTGTLVHEIRTPLTSMQGFTELLMQVQGEQRGETGKLQVIKQGIDRLNILASALGTVFHEVVEPHWMKLSLNELLARVVGRFIEEKELTPEALTLHPTDQDDEIVTDPELLGIVLKQLLANALESLETVVTGSLELTCQPTEEKSFTISLVDQGALVPDSEPSEWWVPFYTTKSGHLGLGLVEVRRLVDTLGGSVAIQKIEKGGVKVSLTLPR